MGLINYVKQLWDTTSFVNPTRLNHMEDGIKATADYADGIAYAECPTARNVVAKVVTCADFKLRVGAKITVRFTATDTSNPTSGNVTLNVNGTGAKGVILGKSNKTAVAYSFCGELYNNQVQEFVYDGTYWVWTNRDTNTTYDGSSLKTKVAKTGSGTTITNTISASTTMDNVIGTLLNNDVALNSSLATIVTNKVGNIELCKNLNNVNIYANLESLSSETQTTIGTVPTEYIPKMKYAALPLYSHSNPYIPVGSLWIDSAGTISIYKPTTTTSAYIFGSYIAK